MVNSLPWIPVRVVDLVRDGGVHVVGESTVERVESVDASLDVTSLTSKLLLSPPLRATVREPDLDARLGEVEFRGESLSRKHVRIVRLLELCEEDINTIILK